MSEYKIIDVHAHIFPDKIMKKAVAAVGEFYGIPMKGIGSGEDLVQNGERIHVEKYVVHSVATIPAQAPRINDFIYRETQIHKEFIGFAALHPYMEGLREELDRALSMGLMGVKLHPDFQCFNIDDPAAYDMYEAIQGRAVLLIHMGDETKEYSAPKRLSKIIERFPQLTVIAAHFGGYSAWEESKKYLMGKDVYFDTSSSLFKLSPNEAADIIHAHGLNKILFGSDYPMWIHEEELERFMRIPLTEAERQAILYDNAAKLLRVKGAVRG